ncbi:ATP-dependent DNA helicase UvrD2 [Corynebacterium sp. ES2794-CONJ1]|uniref:ATP-dependent DNA helicase UvrD2 n=1 Tax=unclassified Corynebacterium TaxID=2624378 RepID=UPI00216ABC97|nr:MULTISPECIES: ATP-dependent DNA helicase UvrD2 [unclassified Corynebacterium]MCS4531370.1 ATP-dependent DNA helicase UvrD2 [Corynebacterium sp. ES2730-CONJ]MCU9518757.1 ATP-dependent DNA helicase UvrD2 [Corynebacterium sp. ES2794-CONJ1]
MINLEDLDSDQRVAATAPRGPVAILAGAGTGKTRTITYRIAHMIDAGFVSPQRVMAVTFTKRAAGEMSHRLKLMGIGGVHARTFHAAALRQLRYFWPQVAGDLRWAILDNKFPKVSRAARRLGIESSKENIRDLLGEIEWAKASLIPPESYAARVGDRRLPYPAEKIAQCYQLYEESKISPEGVELDFDDLLVHVAGALENSRGIAEEFRSQYRSFVVDEYQDVTPLQQRVLNAWLGDRDDLTVVGDANQTIYSFTGATPNFLLDFSRTYAHATIVKLQRDYRSTPQITTLANRVIAQASGRVAGTRLKLEGMRPRGPEPVFRPYDSEPEEARGVAAAIKDLLTQGVDPAEIAILYRINAQSVAFEQALAEAGIVYQVRGGEEFFKRPEIIQAINQLVRAAQREDLPDQHRGPEIHHLVTAILSGVGFSTQEPQGVQARERWESLRALVELTQELGQATPDLDLVGLLGQLKQRADAKHPPSMRGVTLASLHAAKGLEWDAVFLVGLNDGSIPISHALKAGEEAIEEERRLFYVGITRAREHLVHTWSYARQEGGRKSRKRTRFLDGIVAEPATLTAKKTKRGAHRCQICGVPLNDPDDKILGHCQDCPSEADHQLIHTLRSWRLEQAKLAGRPAYTIFSDAVLLALAERRPTTDEQLLAIAGIGPVTVEKFGADLLELLAQ